MTMAGNTTTTTFLLLVALSISAVLGRFTQPTCWYNLCVQQNAAGTWCYIPQSGDTRATTCTGSGADMATVLDVHLRQGLSIAYYNGVGNEFLGGASYSLPANHGIIRLCVSGRAGDGNYETLCVDASADNVLSGSPYCQVALPQDNVTDGCYDPHANFKGNTNPTATTTFLSSSTSSSRTSPASKITSQNQITTFIALSLLLLFW